jgi:hypothetical protein
METERLERLITLVAPTWVDGEVARLLLSTRSPQQGVIAILNAYLPETAEYYVKRAACCALNFRIAAASAVTGENVQDEFSHSCELAVRDLLGIPPHFPMKGMKPELLRPRPGEVPFLIADPAGVAIERIAATIRSLRVRFPWLNVVLLTREMTPDEAQVASWELDSPLILTPPLGEGDELMASRVVQVLKDLVKQIRGQMVGAA